MKPGHNRREAFRVDDYVKLRVRKLDTVELENLGETLERYRQQYGFGTQIAHHRSMKETLLKSIRVRDAELGRYLEHLEDQVARMVQQMALREGEAERDDEIVPINLSASGAKFDTRIDVAENDYLKLVLRLMPTGAVVPSIARVVRIDATANERVHAVSVMFHRLHDDDRELLVRHIVKVQQRQLQRRVRYF